MQLNENMGQVFRTAVNISPRVSALLGMHSDVPVEGGDCGPDPLCPAWGVHTAGIQGILSELSRARVHTCTHVYTLVYTHTHMPPTAPSRNLFPW